MIYCFEKSVLDFPLTQTASHRRRRQHAALRNTLTIRFTGEEEFLEEQVAMMMQLDSPYLGMVNRE